MALELVTILQNHAAERDEITPERIRLLCDNLSRLDPIAAKSAYNVMLSHRKRFDSMKKIGSVDRDIPYFGEHIPGSGILFSSVEIPKMLLGMLEVMVESADLADESPLGDQSDVEQPGFLLVDVAPVVQKEVPNTVHHTKFVSADKEEGVRFQTKHTYDGYKVRLADTSKVEYLEQTNLCVCFWDGQPYDGQGVRYPKRYIYENGKHRFAGTLPFCDMPCLYAYMCELSKFSPAFRPVGFDQSMKLVMMMFNILYPHEPTIWKAPEREMLDVYGGPYTISQFRRVDGKKRFVNSHNMACDLQKVPFLEL